MTRPIRVDIPHRLGRAEARRRIENGFGSLREQMTGRGVAALFSLDRQWQGDRLFFQGGTLGQRLRGHLEVLDDSVRIEIELPALLAGVAEKIVGRLRRQGQKLLRDDSA